MTRDEFDAFVRELAPALDGPDVSSEERRETHRILARVRSRVAVWQDGDDPAFCSARSPLPDSTRTWRGSTQK
jgi:hypothetical protein